MKSCTNCKQLLDDSCFHKNKSTKSGLAHECKECRKQRDSCYRESHKDVLKVRKREWYLKNRDSILDLTDEQRASRSKRKKEWVLANQEHVRRYKREWSSRNRDKMNRYKRKRRDGVGLSEQDEVTVLERFGSKCFKCGSVDDLQFDHHIPLVKGGALTLDNTVILCKICNGRKTCLDPERFYSTEELERLEEMLNHGKET